jgi:peptidoglycan/xylan/chitin deacetylase (PgdA/CDA1 family)
MYFHGDRNKNKISLTFDDGPSEETLNVLDVLKKYNVKATFFLVGKMIKGREYIIERIKDDGHEFGNHTFSHKRLWFKPRKFVEEDINKCDEELQRVGIVTDLIRFPGLKYDINTINICKKLHKLPIFAELLTFNQFAYDWFRPWLNKVGFTKSPIKIDTVIKKTIEKTRNGSILGFHDYLQEIGPNPESHLIIEKIIPELQKKGFIFVTVSKLLFDKN